MIRTAVPVDAMRSRASGFSLIELMVAILLGVLLSIGIVTLFGATSKTNKVQDALAQLQENGRYAVTRIVDDLRMSSGQYCSNANSLGWTTSANDGPMYPGITVMVNANGASTATNGSFPDSGGLLGRQPVAGATYNVGPADFMRGYECDLGGGCAPAPGVPSGAAPDGLPAEGLGAGNRVRGADVLTVRYQNGSGWNFTVDASAPPKITLVPAVVGGQNMDDTPNFQNLDRALLLTCGGGQVFQVTAAGNVLTPTGLQNVGSYKPSPNVGSFDVRVFNFSRDFTTVSYYLAYKADPDNAARMIPSLYRRVNGSATPDELVQGVERMDFIYGVQYADASQHYLTADEISANSNNVNCSPPSPGLGLVPPNVEPSCLWRSVRSIEVHLLLDTVNDIDMTDADMAYRYTADGDTTMQIPPAHDAPMPTGMLAGRMMRREFIASIVARNGNH